MGKIKIVQAKTQKDCEICDAFLDKLCLFESQFDEIIEPTIGGKHFSWESLKHDYVYLAYANFNEKPVGYIMGYLKCSKGQGDNTNVLSLGSVFVEKNVRKMGVGNELVKSFEEWAEMNFENDFVVELTVINGNENAFKFYEELGFKPVKTILRKKGR